jgi:phospholipid transport system transporter-binding protein
MSLADAERTADPGAFQLTATAAGALSAQGQLTFATARRACELGVQTLTHTAGAKLEIDCQGITLSDSAGLAVLLEWLGVARRAGRSLRYTKLPEGLAVLAHISDVQELLERGV